MWHNTCNGKFHANNFHAKSQGNFHAKYFLRSAENFYVSSGYFYGATDAPLHTDIVISVSAHRIQPPNEMSIYCYKRIRLPLWILKRNVRYANIIINLYVKIILATAFKCVIISTQFRTYCSEGKRFSLL